MKKIALPLSVGNQIDNHFGHCEMYAIYTIPDSGEILKIETINSEQGCGCKSNIASVLTQQGVTLMLAGGIGDGAIRVLHAHGIGVIRGCSGNATETVKKYLAGELADSGESCHQHDHPSGNCHH